MAAAAFAPVIPLRFKSYCTLRFLSFYSQTLTTPRLFPPLPRRPFPLTIPRKRCFRPVISPALQSGERAKIEFLEKKVGETGTTVSEFRQKLKIAHIKGGPDEGLDRVGQTLVVMGWVRTLRVQSSVTFLEVNDGSCLSNMQCVMNSDAEGYDQVESGLIATGASIWVQGILVASQGSKQKVELKVDKVVVVR
ncbi:asparagine--tRNA ligase, chloroplastic/mitochondrial-like [Durio zibethinus]|uniref:Asparagine--tRNA ligase, chloroplastic/mitochondrial-like n=1 Tax=Durio zibethinus TaxID=66656 RepID=A0A6P5YFI6_DURZI|nr:asparagine--tRNA ligase, chloroplastic/mitochondrial-like [Durio zibethinus]